MDFAEVRRALPDHEVRAVTMDDVPALVDLTTRLTTAILGEPDVSEAEIRDDLIGPHFDLTQDTLMAFDSTGRAVLYGQGYDEHSGSAWVDVYADPEWDDRTFATAADAVVAACVARIAESTAARGASDVKVVANLYEDEHRMREAYERAGLAVERVYWRLECPLDSVEVATVPEGITIRQVDPLDDDIMRQAYELLNDTFSEHHGHVDGTLEEYTEVWREAESLDRDAWWFAYDGTQPVGLLLGDDRRREQGAGYVRSLGVVKQARGRGIARALLLTAFADYQRRGRVKAQLGVDSENTTGATRLYESVGMTSVHSAIALGRELTLS